MKSIGAGWLNSVQAFMILLALGTVAALTVSNILIISLTEPPPRRPISVYEMGRIVRGLDLARSDANKLIAGFSKDPPALAGEAETLITDLLARRLAMPADKLRVKLRGDERRGPGIREEIALYEADGAANPVIYGGFEIWIAQPDGTWKTFKRLVRNPLIGTVSLWKYWVFYVSALSALPLAMIFSIRITRPIRSFAASADRLGAGLDDTPVPVVGPTEIRQAAVALNEMQARITNFVKERTALVGAIAHDLRTPLSNLRFRIVSMEPEHRKAAEAEIRHMEQLIGSTMDYVDNEERPTVAEHLDLGSLLEALVDDSRDRGEEAQLEGDEQVTVAGDLVSLRRLFSNLIQNGLKFGHRVRIRYRDDAGVAVVDIVDDGPGIPEADIPRVFDPFFRGERSRNRSTGGIGLGLSIAQAAVRAHHGSITFENHPKGLTARVKLPAVRHEAIAERSG